VIDPGLDDPGTALARDFVARFSSWGIAITRSPGLAAAMAQLGWEAEAVTHVVITHAHFDHYAGVVIEQDGALVPRFPNARHFVGHADWEGNPERAEPDSDLNRRLGAIFASGLLEVVDGEREIAPGITLLISPGETPGHLAVRVDTADRALFVLGDLVHHACEVEHLDWVPGDRDGDAMRASRARIFAAADRAEGVVVTAHERFPPWGRIVAAGDGYRWERASAS
jgi:glyoxylase-like metal-dependent hydrolase (beta-lactamase superfamily II)